ncbi:carboxypeptidase Q [Diabrotica virgifera virgifera]|uniref:Carboxypeptidase Q n=1 Tax=Diabrotica virgifera virgifera TaxID=50390 RepID=A0ABM5KKK7_DIAVI|nr:carboxypeptidase Q [Diabrotica virgifera virgifera]
MLVRSILVFFVVIVASKCDNVNNKVEDECHLPEKLVKEIQSYKPTVHRIIDAVTKGRHKGKVYNHLSDFIDTFGARVSGTKNLENSIDYVQDLLVQAGLENIHGENVTVPHWVRGTEIAEVLEPRRSKIGVLGLGQTANTPPEGITAEVLVVRSFEELNKPDISAAAKGKIVVINFQFERYGRSVKYRSQGPVEAAKHGALAVLIKSVTPFSMYTLHTGYLKYRKDVKKIPALSITVEDANMLQRYQDKGKRIVIKLQVDSQHLPDETSRNLVAEIKGSEKEQKVVIVSGHLDSWDVGVGAMDDGGGSFISWYSMVLLKSLGLRARRTLRVILWTAEEPGFIGAQAYDKAHKNDLDDFTFVMESDEGTFNPLGIEYTAGKKGGCILKEIVGLLEPINATQIQYSESVGSDIAMWAKKIPTAGLLNENQKYFWYHHSVADSLDILDSDTLDKATAVWASVAFVVADLKEEFPRDFDDISKLPINQLIEKLRQSGQKH